MAALTRRTALAAAGLGMAGLGAWPATRRATAAEAATVRAGENAPIGLFWPGLIALKNGFYKAEGLQVDLSYVGSVTASVQQLIGGSIDFGYTTCEVALQAIEKGADASIIGSTTIKYPYSMMSARDVKSAADLKGKTVILPPPRQDIAIFFDHWLKENGVATADVDKVYDGATPNRYAALASGTVAAAAVSQPFDFRAQAEGYNRLVDFGAYVKDYAFVVILARKPWLKENGEATRHYLSAVARSIDWFYDHANRAAAIAILSEASKQNETIVGKTYDYYADNLMPFSRKLDLPPASVENVVKALGGLGSLKSPAKALAAIDLSYLPH